MIKDVYVVRDRVLGTFGQPLFLDSPVEKFAGESAHAEANRWFEYAVKNLPKDCHKVSTDFELYFLGTFDNGNGAFALQNAPVFVANGPAVEVEP